MRTGSILFFLLFIIANAGFAQPETEKKAAQDAISGFFDGLAELDVEKTRSYCTPDVMILETGLLWNFDSLAIRLHSRKGKVDDFKRVNQLEFLKTEIANDIVWLYYMNQATITANGKTFVVKWLESAVLIKEGKKWKIKLLHSTEI